MKIIVFGPQGSGKGTQAELIARRYGWPYVSTGDIFRFHLKNKTNLGKEANEYMKNGSLVPDELTNEIVSERINHPDCVAGFVLDGYPRNKAQLEFLDKVSNIDLAIIINLGDEQAIRRLSGRLACKCGLSYHSDFNPPKKEGICDKCSDRLFRREDDNPEAIRKRLEIYHQETKPLLDIYQNKKKLFQVDGSKSIEEVFRQIENVINIRLKTQITDV
jgi:adenylate kinase